MTTWYLAARYSRRAELAGYAAALTAAGHTITATWLDGTRETADGTADRVTQAGWAMQDLTEIGDCRRFLLFTTPGDTGRGGHMVELGIAITCGKQVTIIGPRSNIFTQLRTIRQYDTWQAFWVAEMGEG